MDMTEIDDLKTRYARQMSLPEVGEEGQMRLTEKRAAIIGAGGGGAAGAAEIADRVNGGRSDPGGGPEDGLGGGLGRGAY